MKLVREARNIIFQSIMVRVFDNLYSHVYIPAICLLSLLSSCTVFNQTNFHSSRYCATNALLRTRGQHKQVT
jgi:hypothetical protein